MVETTVTVTCQGWRQVSAMIRQSVLMPRVAWVAST